MTSSTSTRRFLGSPLRAWLVALLLGLAGRLLHGLEAPILTEESPLFTMWQAPVLAAFVLVGPLPGLLSGLLTLATPSFFELWHLHPGVGLGASIYLLEVAAASWLYGRLRSLPLAIVLFWITCGWIFDALIFVVWVGLSTDYVVVLFVKQILNGVLYAALVDLTLTRRVRRLAAGPGSELDLVDIERHAFRGVVVLAMLPVAVVGILYARAQYSEVLQSEEQSTIQIAFDCANELRQALEERQAEARVLWSRLDQIQEQERREGVLRSWVRERPGVRVAGILSASGLLTEAHPPATFDGLPAEGRDLSDLDFYRRLLERPRTTFSNVLIGRFATEEDGQAPVVVVADPVLDSDGAFGGALLRAVSPEYLLRAATAGGLDGRDLTLLDARGVVVASTDPTRSAGMAAMEFVLDSERKSLVGTALDLDQRTELSYYPPRDQSTESTLDLDLIHAVYQPGTPPGWGALVDLPAAALHHRFLPTALRLVALFVLLVVAVFLVVRRFAHRLTLPVRSAASVAQQVREGTLGPETMERMLSSDLIEMRHLADTLEELDRALQHQRRASEAREETLQSRLLEAEKLEAVGLLAGGVAHDFNNLLTPILGYADLGIDGPSDEQSKHLFEKIRSSARQAAEVTGQLLAFGRRQVLDMEAVDLVTEIRGCRTLLRPLLREGIELSIHEGVDRAPVVVDTGQFHRILFNLALNAQDAMPEGGVVTVGVEEAASAPGLGEDDHTGSFFVVSVSDDGEGIPESVGQKIFEPFFSTKGPERGTGLGLPTVYGIARQHGGTVDFVSEEGAGTTFRVYLPRREPGALSSPSEEQSAPRVEGRGNILLAEDDGAVRRVIVAYLEKDGYEVTGRESAEAILEIFEKDPSAWDLLISDVVLPAMDGRDLWARIQEIRPGLPVLFVSGYGHEILSTRGIPAGCQLLLKPFTREELSSRLATVLQRPS